VNEMRTTEQASADVGVIIGRWQVDDLHEAHTSLIEEVRKNHKRVIIFVGLSDILGGVVDPLDYPTRAAMLLSTYPDVTVLPIQDVPGCDEVWSKNLDGAIRTIYPVGAPLLYGGRDSFVAHYTGRFSTVELDALRHPSGTEIREEVGREVRASSDFRAGVIYSTFNQFPRLNMVVDVAVIKRVEDSQPYVLLGKKRGDEGFRFPGGFVDVRDMSLEAAARREVREETGVLPETVEYLGSFPIADSRMGPRDGMMSAFFLGHVMAATPVRASDDLDEAHWIPASALRSTAWYKNHTALFETLCARLGV
jgi:bifunctional NMN adenylyltransferase/nudix hydrolase